MPLKKNRIFSAHCESAFLRANYRRSIGGAKLGVLSLAVTLLKLECSQIFKFVLGLFQKSSIFAVQTGGRSGKGNRLTSALVKYVC